MFPTTDPAHTLALTIVVAIIYLAILRFVDMNEKEPLWALALLFFLGMVAGGVITLIVDSIVLELTVLSASIAEESGRFAAVAIGVAALWAIGRLRGWSEISGLMDGIVYGAAAGLGFATGQVFIQRLLFSPTFATGFEGTPLTVLWSTALVGLADGLFGAIIGIGFGAAVQVRSAVKRIAYPLAGLVGAVMAHAGYLVLARGNALGGSAGLVRAWVALLLPLLCVIAVAVYALSQEKRTIRKELADEAQTGAVTSEDLAILQNLSARRWLYFKALAKWDYELWSGLKALHNRQVQLALAKRRASRETNQEHRPPMQVEVERLRAAVLDTKRALASRSRSTGMQGAKTR